MSYIFKTAPFRIFSREFRVSGHTSPQIVFWQTIAGEQIIKALFDIRLASVPACSALV